MGWILLVVENFSQDREIAFYLYIESGKNRSNIPSIQNLHFAYETSDIFFDALNGRESADVI
jgi:hypothetical protein